MFVCLFVCPKIVIVIDYVQIVKDLVLCYILECISMALRILNCEGHQNHIICSKVTAILMEFVIHNQLIAPLGQAVLV